MPAEARLPPDLVSVGLARHLVEESMMAWGLADGLRDDVVLVTSELVTNAVLHARTPVAVRIEQFGAGVRLEVDDESDQPLVDPLPAPPADATTEFFEDPDDLDLDQLLDVLPATGRGLSMVSSLCDGWGSQPVEGGGKQVWAVVGAGVVGPTAVDPTAVDPTAHRLPDTEVVHLVAVPTRLIAEAQQDFDAVARELQVSALSGAPDQAIHQMASAMEDLLGVLAPLKVSGHDAVRHAVERGDRVVDLDIDVTATMRDSLPQLGRFLGQVAAARREQLLLTLPPPPEVVEFRRWYAVEVHRQHAALPAEPCPFPVIPPSAVHPRLRRDELSQRRQALLGALRQELAAVGDRRELVDRVLDRTRSELGAHFAAVYVVDGGAVVCLGRTGSREDATTWARFPFSHQNPSAEAIRTGRSVVLRTLAERLARYPDLGLTEAAHENPALVTVPMNLAGPPPSAEVQAAGSLTMGFAHARDFSPADLIFLHRLAELVAAALEPSGP